MWINFYYLQTILEKQCHNDLWRELLRQCLDKKGQSENKVVEVAIHHFVKRNLDGLFIATNAPGRSAYNRVSRDLCGLVLPHDFYGNHLNNKNETIDEELEKSNFRKAAETLAEIWSESIIDGYEIVGSFTEDDVRISKII